jgi:TRAP-type C4-dicarboxylate transport system substrate-binding protein
MGQIPTRAWDTQGLATFTALQAPFLITDYALLKKVLAGPVGGGMLAGTRAFGVRTLGLAARDLRVPLGARRPFVAPADFRGATLRVPSASRVSTAVLEALGARAASIASGLELWTALRDGGVDGAESSLYYILGNGYYQVAKYVTTNLVFFPSVESFAINERVFRALTPQQRSILTRAGKATTASSFRGIQARDREQLHLLCTAGLKVAASTPSQLAALRKSEQPVYKLLERDRVTARRIAQIHALKKRTKPMPAVRTPAGCAA